MAEKFVCLDCLCVEELNQNGRCATCNSDNVISAEIVKASSAAGADSKQCASQAPKDSTIYGYLVTHPAGFECFVSNSNRVLVYNECSDPLTKWYLRVGNMPEPEQLNMQAMTRSEYIDWIKRERV